MTSASATYARDIQTRRTVGGVRLSPQHILSKSVHAFRMWTDDRALVTWCGIPVDLADGGVQTTELISCQGCPEASWKALR